MQYIKQSTAATLKIGPFLDDTDGKTPETALTIAQADVRLSKNGGNIAQKTEATSCTHDELGIYGCPIDVTDTDTLGRLQLFVTETGALPIWHEYSVIPANVYDSMFSTDKLEVDILQMGGVAQSATDLKDFADAGFDPATHKVEGVKLADTTTTNTDMVGTDNAALATGVELSAQGKLDVNAECDTALTDFDPPTRTEATADKDALLADLLTMKQPAAGAYDRESDSLEAIRDRGDAAWSAAAGNPNLLLDTTIATLASQTSFTLTAGSDDNDAYKDQAIVIYDASNNDYPSVRKVSAYVGATKTVTLDSAPDFIAIAGDGVKTFVTAPGTAAPTAGQVADAVLDELVADHAGAGSLSKAVSDILEDTNTTIPGTIATLQSDATAILADVTGINGDAMVGTNNAALASVCTEVRLARLNADISSRSSHDAAAIWTAGARELSTPSNYKANISLLALASVCTEARLAELDAAKMPTDIDSILADTGIDGVVIASGSKTGYALSSAGVDAILDEVIENTTTLRQMLRIFTAALAGKSTGGGTATLAFRDILDTKDRINATVDANGNRTAISIDGT